MGAAPDGAGPVAGGAGLDVAGYGARDDAAAAERPTASPTTARPARATTSAAAVERLEGGAGADVIAAAPGSSTPS